MQYSIENIGHISPKHGTSKLELLGDLSKEFVLLLL